ncbi:MAG TPA: Gfo/Idh/MocA family oxidoreductase [Candidatus Limnocylindrales bacterium]
MSEIGVGLIGGGLMGKELAPTLARWPSLQQPGSTPVLRAVCDTNPAVLGWFSRVASVQTTTDDYRRLLDDPSIEVLYIAVPHHLHERIFIDAIEAGKDVMAEKPFGLDLDAARVILAAVRGRPDAFVRVSSEIPFFPGAQKAIQAAVDGELGEVLDVRVGLEHAGDLDRTKPINWKRQRAYCGPGGVMADLGMHALHAPLRIGWLPETLFAVLTNMVEERPGPDGEPVACDTFDNATLLATLPATATAVAPMIVDMKRISPGELNTWRFRAVGMSGGVEYTTRYPGTLRRFAVREGRQGWVEEGTGTASVSPTSIPAAVEFGFTDAVFQMWAAFFAERDGSLGDRFGCATPDEAFATQRIFTAALRSHERREAVELAAIQ